MSTEREKSSSEVHAPYGFVPLHGFVYHPGWAGEVSHDHPFEDGICGVLDLTLHAETPIFVRGGKKPDSFFEGPNGCAIPGSGVRGAIRNVVEIASFGWMRRVNNHRYGVRDLHNAPLYVRHMADIMPDLQGQNSPLPKVVAGWLRKVPGPAGDAPVATISPCDFAKVDYRLLMDLARQHRITNYEPGKRQSAVMKYRRWDVTGETHSRTPTLQVQVQVDALRPPRPEWLGRGFGKARRLGLRESTLPGGVPGTLVFTGQPSDWNPNQVPRRGGGNPKHHDFVFIEPRERTPPIPVPREVMDGFRFVHSDGAQQHSQNRSRQPNEEWGFWERAFEDGHPVPVFFLPKTSAKEGVHVRALGLAMMFRLAYDKSVHDALENAQPGLRGTEKQQDDLADLIFGHVPLGRKGGVAEREPLRKGRVSFGLFTARPGVAPLPEVTAVLGSPKASYYPAYIEQSTDPRHPGAMAHSKDTYTTFMDPKVRIRGYKRYRVQPGVVQGPPPPKRGDGSVNETVATRFRPLPAGARFEGKLRVHNLRPAELGAVLWALDFGQDDSCRHMLGMARSLGYGRSKIVIERARLCFNDGRSSHGSDIVQAARDAFAAEMEARCKEANVDGGWERSRTITELRALARELPATSPHRRHMSIANFVDGRKVNQFVEARKSASALPTALSDEQWAQLAGIKLASQSGGPGPGLAAPAVATLRRDAPAVAPPRHAGWRPLAKGTPVQAILVAPNKKGNWTFKLAEKDTQGQPTGGTITGTAPADAAAGNEVQVWVLTGGNPRELVLSWSKPT